MQVQSLGGEDPLEKGVATHSSILAWRIPWTEESMGVAKTWTQLSDLTLARFTRCSRLCGSQRDHSLAIAPFQLSTSTL